MVEAVPPQEVLNRETELDFARKAHLDEHGSVHTADFNSGFTMAWNRLGNIVTVQNSLIGNQKEVIVHLSTQVMRLEARVAALLQELKTSNGN